MTTNYKSNLVVKSIGVGVSKCLDQRLCKKEKLQHFILIFLHFII